MTDEEREALGEEEEAETAEGEEEAETAEATTDDAADDLDVTERTEVKALMERGREKGFLTYEEVNDALPSDIVSSDQIDDVMSMFGEHDIEVVDDAKKMKLPDKPPEPEAKAAAEEEKEEEEDAGYGKSNDPVRMYLRKMGSVSLLTREGEVEIAKRIEEGEKSVLTSVLASQLAIREIQELGERLKKGKIRVRGDHQGRRRGARPRRGRPRSRSRRRPRSRRPRRPPPRASRESRPSRRSPRRRRRRSSRS